MDRNSNSYTFLFAIIMVVVIASLLAYTATSLKPLQSKNVKNETCLLYTSPSPRDKRQSRMPSSA